MVVQTGGTALLILSKFYPVSVIKTFSLRFVKMSSSSSQFFKWFPTDSVCISCLPSWATYLSHHNHHDFTILSVLGDLYKSQSSLICNILSFLLNSSFLGPKYFPEHIVFQTPVIYVLPSEEETTFFTAIQKNWQYLQGN